MSASAPPRERLHPDDQALPEYTSISRMALLALALGFASSLVLISPLLVVVPLAGVVAAVVAIRSIQTSDGQLLGYWPATIGLCLSVLFVGCGFSRQWTRQNTLIEHSRHFVDGWLRICQEGKLQRADQLMRSADDRIHSDEGIAEFYKTNKEASEGIDSFFTRQPMKSFLAVGKRSRFQLTLYGQARSGFRDEVTFRCNYQPSDGNSAAPSAQAANGATGTFWITVLREDLPGSVAPGWRISAVQPDEPASSR